MKPCPVFCYSKGVENNNRGISELSNHVILLESVQKTFDPELSRQVRNQQQYQKYMSSYSMQKSEIILG